MIERIPWRMETRRKDRPCVVHFLSLGPIDLFPFFFLSCVFLAHKNFTFLPFFRFTNVSNLLLANVLHVCPYITCSSGPTTFIYVNDDEEGEGKTCVSLWLPASGNISRRLNRENIWLSLSLSLCPLCGCKYFVLSGSFIFNSFFLASRQVKVMDPFHFNVDSFLNSWCVYRTYV